VNFSHIPKFEILGHDTAPRGRVPTEETSLHFPSSWARSGLHCLPPLCSPSPAIVGASHCHPSRGKVSPSSPLPLALGWRSSRRSSMSGKRVHHTTFFRSSRCLPPRIDLLWANRLYRNLPHRSPLLLGPRFYSGSRWSAPPLSATSPLTSCTDEPLSSEPPPINSLWTKLPPQLLLLCQLTVGWPESASGTASVKGGGIPVLVDWAERLWSAGLLQLVGPAALWVEPSCTVPFIIFHPNYSNQFNSNSNLVWTLKIHRNLSKFNKIINSIP
jgi:hypothetical protein